MSDWTGQLRLISCVGVEADLELLPHFVRHYTRLGVPREAIAIILNASDANSAGLERARQLLRSLQLEPAEEWIAPYTSDTMWAKRREVQQRVAQRGDWILSADVDEFQEYPESLPKLIAHCERRGINCVQGVLIDRVATDGRLLEVRPDVPLDEQFPIQAEVMCSVGGTGANHDWYGTVKIMACRAEVLPSRGGHHPQSGPVPIRYLLGRPLATFPTIAAPWFRFALPFRVHHFKWTAGLVSGLRQRLATPGVSAAGREYGEKLLNYLGRHERIPVSEIPRRRSPSGERLSWPVRVAVLKRLAQGWAVARRARRTFVPSAR